MASCEKCWRDARGDPDRYVELLAERHESPCTPEQQAGGIYADECEVCGRFTVHAHWGRCMVPDCQSRESAPPPTSEDFRLGTR